MGGKTYILRFSLVAFYFATTNSYVVRAPDPNNTVKPQNNEGTEGSIETTTTENNNVCGTTTDPEYFFFDTTKSCYKVHTDRATWDDAGATCVREGGHLAVLNSKNEADFLLKHFPRGRVIAFIGFHWKEVDESGSWVTIQGQTLRKAGYRNWYVGQLEPGQTRLEELQKDIIEPNAKYGACGALYHLGLLDIAPCGDREAFICEKDSNTKIQTDTTTGVPIEDTTETDILEEKETWDTGNSSEPTLIEIITNCGVQPPCQPSPCGPNSQCRNVNGNPSCSCLVGFTGYPPSCRAECTVSSDCLPDEACSNRTCIKPCPEACGVQALCEVKNHIPICSCPISYSGDPFIRCVSSVSKPKEQTPVNPCYPSLSCGRNAMCMEYLGMPKCACIPGFVGSPPHCKLECRSNTDCPTHEGCINHKCADPCAACGVHTQCRVINHIPSCACLSGFTGDPFDGCMQEVACSINTDCPANKTCLQNKCQDPCPSTCAPSDLCHVFNHSAHCAPYDPYPSACQPSPCGPNSRCRDVNQQAHCSCLPNYIGSPPGCRPECTTSDECSKDKACIDQKCRDPCLNACGINSVCRVINHNAVCQCKPQYTGDPFSRCSSIPPPYDPYPSACQPSPCGPNSRCRDVNQQAHCSCLPNYIGSPPGCRPECTTSDECSKDKACIDQKCRDPCLNACGINSVCRVINHNPVCQCKPQYTGDPFSRCSPITYASEEKETSVTETSSEPTSIGTSSTKSGQEEALETWSESTTIDAPNECGTDTDYKFFEGTKACYKVYSVPTNRATWDNAEATCVREGGHLAVINSRDEADFFVTLMRDLPSNAYQVFLGFHLKEGSWVTIQGQNLSATGYENWKDGEPNNLDGDQYCGSIYPDGTFDDIECWLKLAFICERNPNSEYEPDTTTEVPDSFKTSDSNTDDPTGYDGTLEDEESSGMEDFPEPASVKVHNICGTMDTEYTFYKSTHSCYKVHTDRATWNDAEATCVREGGHLAVINSRDESDTLTTLYPDGAERVFVGFSYREQGSPKTSDMYIIREDGVWLTIDGQTLSEAGFENWTPGEPNNAGGREYCGTIYENGKFDDAACYNEFDFICEMQPNLL